MNEDIVESTAPSLEANPYLIKGERINQNEVAAIAEDFGNFYGLGSEIIEKAKQAEAYIVNETEFAQTIREQIYDDVRWSMQQIGEDSIFQRIIVEQDNAENKAIINNHPGQFDLLAGQIAQEATRTVAGKMISKPDGREIILIKNTVSPKNRKPTLDHEMIHVLASSGFEGGTGFMYYYPGSGYLYTPLNEGATEVLRLHKSYPHVSPMKINYVLSEESGLAYLNETRLVLCILSHTYRKGGSPFTIKDLAGHYFSRRKNKLVDKTDALIQDIEQHEQEKYKKGVRTDIEMLEGVPETGLLLDT